MPVTTLRAVPPRALVNAAVRPEAVPAPVDDAYRFHAALPGYEPTAAVPLPAVAAALGVAGVTVKDESNRLGLPAFKVLGASWAVERTLRERPDVHTLVAASAGNHGRAVAHVAAERGLKARVYLPARSVAARREAIAGEGAEVIVVDGSYEDAVAQSHYDGQQDGFAELADVGDSGPARWVIDGYATLFREAAAESSFDTILVPIGVGSLGAAAARFGAANGIDVIGVEPVTAACLTASLEAGEPVVIDTPGTAMAGLDCAEVSTGAWPMLRDGITATITVDDAEVAAAMRELADAGLAIGHSGASSLAALHALAHADESADVRSAVGFGRGSRFLLIATEGPTDPVAYREAVGGG